MKAPSIKTARDIGQTIGATKVVILALNGEDYSIVTWGKTMAECRTLARWAESKKAINTLCQIADEELTAGIISVAIDPARAAEDEQ